MTTPIMLLADFYKLSHREQYPVNTEIVYSTLTPRVKKWDLHNDEVVFFGLQYFIKHYLIEKFEKDFFARPKEEVITEYTRVVKNALNVEDVYTKHLEDLHDLGYLPIRIKALKEGTLVPVRVPCMTIENTDSRFFWLTNFIETILLTTLWLPSTSATTAYSYRKILTKYAEETVGADDFVDFQAHDFSMRGMSSEQSSTISAAAHLLSFKGSDTVPAGLFLEEFYNADIEKEFIFSSIPATEHSVMSAYGEENEFELYKRLLTDIYPKGPISIVSDTWDFWKVITDYLPKLKDIIISREGKLIIRPDSGDPIDILCGTVKKFGKGTTPEEKGLIECLWEIFGGVINEKGYRCLDSHIGVIYGDSITMARCETIMRLLKEKGFASSNVVLGIGSYAYQFTSRDAFGWAMKATYAVIDGKEKLLFKDPKTDDGTKKSQRGLIIVHRNDKGSLELVDGLCKKDYEALSDIDQLHTVFKNGQLLYEDSFAEICKRVGYR
ncbi:nicotinate phosphoribosyltransferase [Actinomyces sp. zg-332]|uniref:nicotinate phosphoribosyltransferase n=1 Tax=Actinomyces sp. zg-332 TaxID=2708340 RepID=UPI00141D7D92|nr:nicotinate phosphoribosyltransferase [Actinomyces sp. zg-332]QPK94027.1 nicotinate phosphoribosyltransferase [Actinomyces sp. zg-332]